MKYSLRMILLLYNDVQTYFIDYHTSLERDTSLSMAGFTINKVLS